MKFIAPAVIALSIAAAPAAMAFSKPPSNGGGSSSSSGGATDVPAPSMLVLFGIAAAGVALSRKRKA